MNARLLTLVLVFTVNAVLPVGRADVVREYWLNIPGNAVSDLTSSPNFPDSPDGKTILGSFQSPTDWADSYGERVRGWLVAPTSGNYTFWISSDDNSELWLGTSADPQSAALIASVPGWTPPQVWNLFSNQKSASIALVGGQKYYIEALHKEGGGGDNLAVGWAKPGEDTSGPSEVIPGSALVPWTDDPNYNAVPIVHVPPDILISEAPASTVLNATVQDDGKPLPANPTRPDPQDPHQLSWTWSELSSPPESQGVAWSGQPRNGHAFTYNGSANPPKTPFISSPTATFDVPGTYVLQFSATDGDKTTARQVQVLVKSTRAYRDLGYAYLSPLPRSEYSSPQTRYVLVRLKDTAPAQITNFSTFIQVTGVQSGPHPGQTAVAGDGRTIRFMMNSDFTPDESVTVSINPQLAEGTVGTLKPYQYQFMVSGFFPPSPLISARGDFPPTNGKSRAFDGNPNTQWADFIVPDGLGTSSWIQYLYPGSETHIVNAYALASASDFPERDPADWKFYGVDGSGNLTLLDQQSGKVFGGRSQWMTNRIANSTDFRGYRLEITRVRNPALAAGVQLAELQLLRASGSVLREYWTDISGVLVNDLTSNPRFPNQPSGRDLLPTFEAPTDWADYYGTRVRGYLTAPRTGSYTFWIASDDGGELWLSTDSSPTNRTRIARVPNWTPSRNWTIDPAQKSGPISLVAGQRYYIEALQKEGGGGDNLAVGWAKPGQSTAGPSEVIPGEVLTPWVLTTAGVRPLVRTVARPRSTLASGDSHDSPGVSPGRRKLALDGPVGPIGVGSPTFPNGVSVPDNFPRINIAVNNNPDPNPIFLDNRGGGGNPYNVIFDNSGSPIWYRRMPDERRDMKVQHNGVLTMLARDNGTHFNGFDTNYNLIKTYWADNGYGVDEHELQVLTNGNYLLIGLRGETVDMTRFIPNGNPGAGVTEQIIQEFTAAGELIFQWRAWDHFDIRDQGEFIDITGGGFDFPHINAIDIDTDGNIVISSRSLSEITKIDRTTGDFIWRLGGHHNQMTFINDPLQGPRNQHAIRSAGTNHYTLFDNGDLHTPSMSRGVEYQVDTNLMTATVVWQYPKVPDPNYYSFYMGDTQRLPNGNTLINWAVGNLPKLTEIRPDGSKAFEMNWVDGFEAYRVWRCPWKGVAVQPYLIAESNPDNVTLTFNQFGDTHVAYYKIYGGPTPQSTNLLASSVVTRQVLTHLNNGQTYYFRVSAVNDQGVEGQFSNEESVLVNIVHPGQNSLQNGDFSQNQTGWNLSQTDTGTGNWSVVGGAAKVAVSTPGSSYTSLQLQQPGVVLIQGNLYLFEFDAWADRSRVIQARIAQSSSPFTDYSRIGYVSLGTSRKHFRYVFRMTKASDFGAVVEFGLGSVVSNVFIDNVTLIHPASGDLNTDGHVDWQDLKALSNDWLKANPITDLNHDGRINFLDLEVLGQNWTGN